VIPTPPGMKMIGAQPLRQLASRMAGRVTGGMGADWAYASGWMAVRAMPEFAARNAFEAGARYAARGGGPDQLRKNLARVLRVPPEDVPDSLMRASLASYALPGMDLVALGRELHDSVLGRDHVEAALSSGRGAVIALPHSGNWDMAGVWLAQTHGTFTTVAERLKPESLYRRFIAYRERLGFEVLPLSGGDRPPFDVLCDRLRANRVVCLMAERDLTRTGVQVDFFGEPTRLPAGPAKLAIATGAVLLPAHCWFEDRGWGVSIGPPLDCTSGDVGAITQAMADHFEKNIAARPEDWHMMQPQWLADLPEAKQARLKEI
jgi:lauroyl/myristoyl acyltransferase